MQISDSLNPVIAEALQFIKILLQREAVSTLGKLGGITDAACMEVYLLMADDGVAPADILARVRQAALTNPAKPAPRATFPTPPVNAKH